MHLGSHVRHHKLHLRKKRKKDGTQKILDKLVYFAGIAGPVMTLPQVFKIWAEKSASGVAVETWATYLILSVIWISYGILHKEKPLIIMYSSYFVINISIIVGIALYA
jgi:uncharacterized protein with PQ loop repeat